MASGAEKSQKRAGKSGASPASGAAAPKPRGQAAKRSAKPAGGARPKRSPVATVTVAAASAVPVHDGPALRKRELIDAVAERSGVRKKHAKAAIEAMLDALAGALAEGREINLQPFGRISPKRMRETAGARVVTAQIRQSKADATPASAEGAPDRPGKSTQTVADAAE